MLAEQGARSACATQLLGNKAQSALLLLSLPKPSRPKAGEAKSAGGEEGFRFQGSGFILR
jgi:hypothetical protein